MTIKRKAFTLIELLVVIAIIALLLAILLPALNKVKAVARNLVCRTNVRSLVIGFRLYVESNDQQLLRHGEPGKDENLWMMEIEGQVGKVDKVRYCPSTKLNPQSPPFIWPNGMGSSQLTWIWPYNIFDSSGNPIAPGNVTSEQAEYGSYAHNYWLYGDDSGYFMSLEEWKSSSWQTASPPNSSSVPIFVDCKWVDLFPRYTDTCPAVYNLSSDGGGGMLRAMMSRHGDSINVGFMDGHAESVRLKDLWGLKWSKSFNTLGEQTRDDDSPIYQRDK